MNIIKRNGAEEVFDNKKIIVAVTKADTSGENRSLTDSQIEDIAEFVEFKCKKLNRAVSVEEIQEMLLKFSRDQVIRVIVMRQGREGYKEIECSVTLGVLQ